MLNTLSKEHNSVFYSHLASLVTTVTLSMYLSMAYAVLTRRNMVC